MVERFYRNLKLVIHAAYSEGRDPEDEVEKYVAAYGNTPHSVTGKTPNLLMFNRKQCCTSSPAHHRATTTGRPGGGTERRRPMNFMTRCIVDNLCHTQ